MGICNKIAGIIAVYVLGSIVLSNADEIKIKIASLSADEKAAELNALASRVITPYIFIAASLALLAVIIYFINLPEIREQEDEDNSFSKQRKNIFQFPHLLLGALSIFFYVGVEVISYDTFANFGEFLGYPLDTAKSFASYTGYGLLAGYVLGIICIPKYHFTTEKLWWASTILSIASGFVGHVHTVVWPPLICFALLRFFERGSVAG